MKYGIKRNRHRWFTNYLTIRRQRAVDDCHPDLKTKDSRVPQGSGWDPFLFLLLLNDILNQTKLNSLPMILLCIVLLILTKSAAGLSRQSRSLFPGSVGCRLGVKFNESKS